MTGRARVGALALVVLMAPAARAERNTVALVAFEADATEAEVLVDVAPGLMLVRQRVVLAPQQAAGELALRVHESPQGTVGVPFLRFGARLAGEEVALDPEDGPAPGARVFRGAGPLPAGEGQVLAFEAVKLLDWVGVEEELVLELILSASELFAAGADVAPRVAVRLHGLPADAVVRTDLTAEGDVFSGTLDPAANVLRLRLAMTHEAFLQASQAPAAAALSPEAQLLHQALRLRAPAARGDWAGTLVLLQTASESTGHPGVMARRLLAGLRDACARLPKEAALPGGAGFPEGVSTDAELEDREDCAARWVRGAPLLEGEEALLPDGLEEEVHAGYYARPRNRGLWPLLGSVAVLMLVTLVWQRRRTR